MSDDPRKRLILAATAGAGAVTALVGAGVVIFVHDSAHTDIPEERMEVLRARPVRRDDKTPLMQQMISLPESHHPLCVMLELFDEADKLSRKKCENEKCIGPIPGRRGEKVCIPNPVPGDTESSLEFQVIATAYNEGTALKALALYHPEANTLVFSFPGMNPDRDLPNVAYTISGQHLGTLGEIKEFMGFVQGELAGRGITLPVANCIIGGNSLGAGSATYALATVLRDMPRLSGSPPVNLLVEPWQAVRAAKAVCGEDISALREHTAEVRCVPGTPLAQDDNPSLSRRDRASILMPVSKGGKRGVFSRLLFHSHVVEAQGLRDGSIMVIESSPEELDSIRATHVATTVKKGIEVTGSTRLGQVAANMLSKTLDAASRTAEAVKRGGKRGPSSEGQAI